MAPWRRISQDGWLPARDGPKGCTMKLASTRGTVVVSDWTAEFFEATQVPAAVQHDSTVWVTGQTGTLPDGSLSTTVNGQIRQAFANVGECLMAAGASWADVVEMNTYSIGLRDHGEVMLEIAAEFLDPPFPAWTAVGVTELWEEGAVFELQCVAVVPRTAGPDQLFGVGDI
jgi:enamine deaminase RidA (YjgF/YER057c/UK114 family)